MRDMVYDEFIDRLRSDSDIVAVVSDYVELVKRGRNFWGRCPFHHEKTPSFSVTPDKGFFYCFGCQTGGNVFNFLMKIENITFIEAVKLLAVKMNVPLPETSKSPADHKREQELIQLYKANKVAKDFFNACLTKSNYGHQAQEYLLKRGIDEETVKLFNLGFAPPLWDKLIQSLQPRNISPDILVKAGLAIERTNDQIYDRFRNRIMYPIVDLHGQVVGFGGRVMDQSQPKYLNSPETAIFNKRHILYGLNLAISDIKSTNQVVIVEGYMDMIACYTAGVKNVVASLGTAFTREQARLLLRYAKELVFAYDNDSAGQNATLRALSMVRSLGASVRVVMLTAGKDPDECIRKIGATAFQGLVQQAPSLLEYQLQAAITGTDTTTLEGKLAAVDKALAALALLDNAVEINSNLAKLAQTLNLDEAAIRSEFRKHIRMNKKDNFVKNGQNSTITLVKQPENIATITAEQQIIRLLIELPQLRQDVLLNIVDEDIQDQARQEIINTILLMHNSGKQIDPATLSAVLSERACAELSNIVLKETATENVMQTVADCVRTLRLARLNSLYEKHRLQADEYERMGDSRFLQELAESQRIKDEIIKLHQ